MNYILPDNKLSPSRVSSPCIEWQRGKSGGYGIWRDAGGAYQYERMHRVAYRQAKGEIPKGYEIHHVCRNRACINPEHLEALAPGEHQHRHRKEFCQRGHRLSDENVYVRPDNGKRWCRECRRIRERKREVAVAA